MPALMQTIDLLLIVAEKSAVHGRAHVTTGTLATILGVSQQTISNTLRKVETQGLLDRHATPSGITVALTDKGRLLLKQYQHRLTQLRATRMQVTGTVFAGIGEGSFYMMQPQYLTQFRTKLGLRPVPGTLNLRVDPTERTAVLNSITPIPMKGFVTRQRTFGNILCYRVRIESLQAFVVVPERTHYAHDTMEIIAEKNLREALKLTEGSTVTISAGDTDK